MKWNETYGNNVWLFFCRRDLQWEGYPKAQNVIYQAHKARASSVSSQTPRRIQKNSSSNARNFSKNLKLGMVRISLEYYLKFPKMMAKHFLLKCISICINKGRLFNNSDIDTLISNRLSLENKGKFSYLEIANK